MVLCLPEGKSSCNWHIKVAVMIITYHCPRMKRDRFACCGSVWTYVGGYAHPCPFIFNVYANVIHSDSNAQCHSHTCRACIVMKGFVCSAAAVCWPGHLVQSPNWVEAMEEYADHSSQNNACTCKVTRKLTRNNACIDSIPRINACLCSVIWNGVYHTEKV